MSVHLTVDRDLAKKVTALAKDAADARDLLLVLGLLAEDPEPQLDVEPGSTYVPPAQRLKEWTRQAGEMSAAGRSTAEIAVALAIDEDTAAELVGNWWAGVGR
ncbi:hypothetical protein ACFOSC_27925 [Streptantibioticus rubrisoli]|uniref:Uncharacterized protein n=1 Tax=Streptantibioticus rubrisoli TaxID=1387313 RepID=A0ABT1PKC3_9ACTN|nr:hypothetical protein [Streptantibioticus rubrisoli]MCQ4045819.1 hypothetical protein [Streptantibioticus rubrisoli]